MNPTIRIILIAVALLAAGIAAYTGGLLLAPKAELAGTELTDPIDVSGLSLQAAGNRDVTLADYAGGITAVFFGYTRCPDVCPITMSRLADAYRDLGEPDNLKVVMVTVDPGYDTPEITDNYAKVFHPDFEGLGGSNQQVAEAAATFYVGYNDIGSDVIHTDAVMLLDSQGRFRMLYSTDRLPSLTGDLASILASSDW